MVTIITIINGPKFQIYLLCTDMQVQENDVVVKGVKWWHKESSYTANECFFCPLSDLEEELLEEDWLSGKKVREKKSGFYISITFC